MEDVQILAGGKKYVIREVEALKAMGALITMEADFHECIEISYEQGGQSHMDGQEILQEQRNC